MEENLAVHILGLTEEEAVFKTVAEKKIRQSEMRDKESHSTITEVTVVIKRQQLEERIQYRMTARAAGEIEQFIAKAEGWSLRETFDELCKNLAKAFRKESHPKGIPKKWGSFLR